MSEPQTSTSMVTVQLYKLFRVLWSGKWAGVTPLNFVKCFVSAVPSFRGYKQHDAHEFLMALLDQVHVELQKISSPSPSASLSFITAATMMPQLQSFIRQHFESVQVLTHTHIHIHIHTRAHIHTYMHTHMQTHSHSLLTFSRCHERLVTSAALCLDMYSQGLTPSP